MVYAIYVIQLRHQPWESRGLGRHRWWRHQAFLNIWWRYSWWRHNWWRHGEKYGWSCLARARTNMKNTKETVYHCITLVKCLRNLMWAFQILLQVFFYHIKKNYKTGLKEKDTPPIPSVAWPLPSDKQELCCVQTIIHKPEWQL